MKAILSLFVFVALLIYSSCDNTPRGIDDTGNSSVVEMSDASSAVEQVQITNLVEEWESQDRLIWQKPDMIIDMIDDIQTKTVADIGAGTGYFSFRMASKAHKVIAIDISEPMVAYMDSIKYEQLSVSKLNRFEARYVEPHDSGLKNGEADAVLIVNTYIYIEDRIAYFQRLRDKLSDKAQLLIVDYKSKDIPVGPAPGMKMSPVEITEELVRAGYTIRQVNEDSLEYQYIIIAEKV